MLELDINTLSNPGLIKKFYNLYYCKKITPDDTLSSYWAERSEQIELLIDEHDILKTFKGCSFGDLANPPLRTKVLYYLCNLSYFVRSPNKRDMKFLLKESRHNLKKMGYYLTYDCFRQACSLAVIRKYFHSGENEKVDILMIGDGYGFLASLVKRVCPNARITLIDIGKVLLFQLVNLQKTYPNHRHISIDEFVEGASFDFLYVPAERISEISDIKFGLTINIASMQEMTYDAIKRYFQFLRTHSTSDNLFYCCNRALRKLPGGEVTEFYKYPWDQEDEHIVNEVCDFYRYRLSWRPPYIIRFEGEIIHRLTKLKTQPR